LIFKSAGYDHRDATVVVMFVAKHLEDLFTDEEGRLGESFSVVSGSAEQIRRTVADVFR